MSTRRILTPEYHAEILATPNTARGAIMAPVVSCGSVELCERWSKPFIDGGLETVVIPVGAPNIDEILPHMDALLLPGGDSNVHPSHYREDCSVLDDSEDDHDILRDVFAFDLIKQAYALNIPTLGICRGMQEMVVAFGGALEKIDSDAYDHAAGYKDSKLPNGARLLDKMDESVHPIYIKRDSLFHDIFKELEITVNSIHLEGVSKSLFDSPKYQKIRDIFSIEALAPDNVIEGISAKGKRFFVGVQPHFEIGGPLHDALFDRYFSHIFAHHNARLTSMRKPSRALALED